MLAATLAAACGGGNSGGGSNGEPPPAALTVAGTAATGAAIGGATVLAKCRTGSGSATTQADGRYVITMADGSLPCVLQVTPANDAPLHSVIDGSGAATVTANITPLTELIVARVAGGAPADLYATFDAAAQAKLESTAVRAAVQAVASALQGAVDLAGIDPIKDPLVAANAGEPGNALDQKLDTLSAVLAAARTTLAELRAAVVASAGTPAAVQTMLRPAAASCSGLRSGSYLAISPVDNDDVIAKATALAIDATALTVTFQEGATSRMENLVDDGGCAFSLADDGESRSKFLVSPSGLAIVLDTATAGPNVGLTWVSGIVIPVQEIPASELAGTWNGLEYFRDPVNGQPSFAPGRHEVMLDASGTFTASTSCDSAGTCTPGEWDGAMLTVNAAGGFDIGGNASEPPSRVLAFKTPDGHLSMFLLYSTGRGMVALTKQAELALPAVDSISNIWDVSISSNGSASAVAESAYRVTSLDPAAGTLTRVRTNDNRIDTLKYNDPRPGLRSRAANSCTINGAASSCSGLVSMPLPGTGISVYTAVAPANFFGISIRRP